MHYISLRLILTLMKRTLLLLSLFAGTISFAQISKGNVLAGGSGIYSSTYYETENLPLSSRTETFETSEIAVNLNGGYFVLDKLAVGARVGVNWGKSEFSYDNWSGESSTSYWGPFVRYYFLQKSKTVNLFADAGYSSQMQGIFKKNGSPLRGYTLMAGPAFFLNHAVALEFTLGYSHRNYKNMSDRYDTILSGAGLQIHLGKGK